MAKQLEVKVPDIGDFKDVPVIEVLVAEGDHVEKETPLITLESEKATMEVPAPAAGMVRAMKLKEGDKVSEGSLILLLDTEEAVKDQAAAAPPPPPPAAPAAAAAAVSPTRPPVVPDTSTPQSARSGGASAGSFEVKVPDIGDFKDVPVIEVLVAEGDHVEKETPLITLESEKATMEVPAPAAGMVRAMKLKEGDKVSEGSLILLLDTEEAVKDQAAAAPPPPAAPAAAAVSPTRPPVVPDTSTPSVLPAKTPSTAPSSMMTQEVKPGLSPYASPSVRKYARELGADLRKVTGSGRNGRILQEDVKQYIKLTMGQRNAGMDARGLMVEPPPVIDFSLFGEIETKPLIRIRRLSAAHLHSSWISVPHVTQTDEADITEMEAFRHGQNSRRGFKLTLLPFILKAASKALDAYPEFSASLDATGENLVMKRYRHLGFAADTVNGLVVPVVRHVNQKGIEQLARETAALAAKARDGKLTSDEMKGGVFSVSSLGGIGGGYFTPIVNTPEVGILGVSRAVMKPVWDGSEFRPRLMLPLSLSYDHRVIDGAYAARFIVHLVALLTDLRRLLL